MIIAVYIMVVFSSTNNKLKNNVFFDCYMSVISVFFLWLCIFKVLLYEREWLKDVLLQNERHPVLYSKMRE